MLHRCDYVRQCYSIGFTIAVNCHYYHIVAARLQFFPEFCYALGAGVVIAIDLCVVGAALLEHRFQALAIAHSHHCYFGLFEVLHRPSLAVILHHGHRGCHKAVYQRVSLWRINTIHQSFDVYFAISPQSQSIFVS